MKEKSEIRKIIEKHATQDNTDWCDLYDSIKDWDFDKLEEELQEYMDDFILNMCDGIE